MNFFTGNSQSSPGRGRGDKMSALFILLPLFLRETLARFYKVRNSYSAIIAAQCPVALLRMIMAILYLLAQTHDTEAIHWSWGGTDWCIQNIFAVFSWVFLSKEKLKNTFNELLKSWIFRYFNCAVILLRIEHCTVF